MTSCSKTKEEPSVCLFIHINLNPRLQFGIDRAPGQIKMVVILVFRDKNGQNYSVEQVYSELIHVQYAIMGSRIFLLC